MTPWGSLLTDTITVADESSISDYGDPTFGSTYTLAARVEQASALVRDQDGNEVQSNTVITTEVAIPRTSRVWFPGESTTATTGRTPISTKSASLPEGGTLYETRF